MKASLLAVCLLATLSRSVAFGDIISAGTDTVSSSTGTFTLTIFGGFTENIALTSLPFSIVRDTQVGLGDGSGTITTHIPSLTFTGVSTHVGIVTVRIGSANGVSTATDGIITDVHTLNPSSSSLAGPDAFVSGNSSFNVYFEIDAGPYTFYNKDPDVMSAFITSLPPRDISYRNLLYVNLYDKNGDALVGTLSNASHNIPEPTSLALAGIGLAAFFVKAACRRQRAKSAPLNE
jgi:hypothetical protein